MSGVRGQNRQTGWGPKKGTNQRTLKWWVWNHRSSRANANTVSVALLSSPAWMKGPSVVKKLYWATGETPHPWGPRPLLVYQGLPRCCSTRRPRLSQSMNVHCASVAARSVKQLLCFGFVHQEETVHIPCGTHMRLTSSRRTDTDKLRNSLCNDPSTALNAWRTFTQGGRAGTLIGVYGHFINCVIVNSLAAASCQD